MAAPTVSIFRSLGLPNLHTENVSKGQPDLISNVATSRLHEVFMQHPIPITILAIVVLLFVKSFVSAAVSTTALNKIPGPWYARYTTIHLKYLFARGTIWKYVEGKHDVYGDVIRLGPRQVWVADKAAMSDILAKTDLPKVNHIQA